MTVDNPTSPTTTVAPLATISAAPAPAPAAATASTTPTVTIADADANNGGRDGFRPPCALATASTLPSTVVAPNTPAHSPQQDRPQLDPDHYPLGLLPYISVAHDRAGHEQLMKEYALHAPAMTSSVTRQRNSDAVASKIPTVEYHATFRKLEQESSRVEKNTSRYPTFADRDLHDVAKMGSSAASQGAQILSTTARLQKITSRLVQYRDPPAASVPRPHLNSSPTSSTPAASSDTSAAPRCFFIHYDDTPWSTLSVKSIRGSTHS